jgi:hypothetical protein
LTRFVDDLLQDLEEKSLAYVQAPSLQTFARLQVSAARLQQQRDYGAEGLASWDRIVRSGRPYDGARAPKDREVDDLLAHVERAALTMQRKVLAPDEVEAVNAFEQAIRALYAARRPHATPGQPDKSPLIVCTANAVITIPYPPGEIE